MEKLDVYLSRVIIEPNGCHVLPVSTMSIRMNGKCISITRLVYEKHVGKIPYRTKIKRLCSNGKCINPNHMLPSTSIDKFFLWVNYSASNGCWEWTGSKDGGGYGMAFVDGVMVKSHRYSWEYYFGSIPSGLWVLHKCDNPACINPEHLFLGTNGDNMKDKVKKERQSRLFGDKNGRCVMTKDLVIELRQLYASGKFSYRDLVGRFNISQTQVARIIKKESWLWVD